MIEDISSHLHDVPQVRLYRAQLDVAASDLAKLEQTLSDDERQRARRFRPNQHRRRFIAARGILRTILAQHLSARPSEMRFDYTEYGRPFLTAQTHGDELDFNLSHRRGLAVYAIARGRRVGVDVEWIDASADTSAASRIMPERISKEQLGEQFFIAWTQWEALLKAIGTGLIGCGDISGFWAALPQGWNVSSFAAADGYAAALASGPAVA